MHVNTTGELNLVHTLQRGQLGAFKVTFNFASLFNQHYEKIKTKNLYAVADACAFYIPMK